MQADRVDARARRRVLQAEEEPEFQLTDEQVSEARDAFNMYDKERKGEIPTSILGTVMKNLGHNLKPDQLAECIDAVDGDGEWCGSFVGRGSQRLSL